MNSKFRSTVSLDGTWSFALDPEDQGVANRWYDSSDWYNEEQLTVPHTWQEDGHLSYTGPAWYRRRFEYTEELQTRIFVRFDAVDYEASVWVNGDHVGTNREGYLPFEVEVTEAVTSGENSLVVRVEDPEDIAEIPHGKQGAPWYTRVSGIWQSVTLEYRPPSYIADVRVTPDLNDDTAIFDIDVEGDLSASTYSLECLISQDGEEVVERTVNLSTSQSGLGERAAWSVDATGPSSQRTHRRAGP